MVLDHARRTFQEIFRYVNNGDLSEESVEYLRYKSEVALNILQMSCLVYDIPSSLIDQEQDIYVTLEEAWKEFQCGTSFAFGDNVELLSRRQSVAVNVLRTAKLRVAVQVALRLGTGLPPGGLDKAGKARLQKQRNQPKQPHHIACASINRVGKIPDHKWGEGSGKKAAHPYPIFLGVPPGQKEPISAPFPWE